MSQKNIREQLDELQAVVTSFEQEDMSVEDALKQFEKGSALSEDIEKQLSELRIKITILKERFDQS